MLSSVIAPEIRALPVPASVSVFAPLRSTAANVVAAVLLTVSIWLPVSVVVPVKEIARGVPSRLAPIVAPPVRATGLAIMRLPPSAVTVPPASVKVLPSPSAKSDARASVPAFRVTERPSFVVPARRMTPAPAFTSVPLVIPACTSRS